MPAVKTGMTPPPMPGMPAPMQPMGGVPPMQNPFAPMPPMPLAGAPMPQPPMPMLPMPQGQPMGQMPQGQQMGSTAGRRRRFGDALEGMIGRNQGIGAAMPQQQRPMPMPQMMPQQRMVAPNTPMMRTPTPRPMRDGGIVQYMSGGGAAKPSIKEFMDATGSDFQQASQALYGSVGSNIDIRDWDAIMSADDPLRATQAATAQMYSTGAPIATDERFYDDSGTYAPSNVSYGGTDVGASTGGPKLQVTGSGQIMITDSAGLPLTGLSPQNAASFGITQDQIDAAIAAGGNAREGRFAGTGYVPYDAGNLLTDYSGVYGYTPSSSSSSGGSDAVSSGGGDTSFGGSSGQGSGQMVGDIGSSAGSYEMSSLYGPNINIPEKVSQFVQDPVTGQITTTAGPVMTAVSPIGAINLPARPAELDIFDYLGDPTYGSLLDKQVEGMAQGGAVPRSAMIADEPHMLAYINQDEEALLRSFGGSGISGPGGIPSYPPQDLGVGAINSGKTYSGSSKTVSGGHPTDDDDKPSKTAGQSSIGSSGYTSLDAIAAAATANDDDNNNYYEPPGFDFDNDGVTGEGSAVLDNNTTDPFVDLPDFSDDNVTPISDSSDDVYVGSTSSETDFSQPVVTPDPVYTPPPPPVYTDRRGNQYSSQAEADAADRAFAAQLASYGAGKEGFNRFADQVSKPYIPREESDRAASQIYTDKFRPELAQYTGPDILGGIYSGITGIGGSDITSGGVGITPTPITSPDVSGTVSSLETGPAGPADIEADLFGTGLGSDILSLETPSAATMYPYDVPASVLAAQLRGGPLTPGMDLPDAGDIKPYDFAASTISADQPLTDDDMGLPSGPVTDMDRGLGTDRQTYYGGSGPRDERDMYQAPEESVIAKTIAGFEGRTETPYWDVNANRAGYGSDTKTDPETGEVTKITSDTTVSKAEADADLNRRLTTEFIPRLVDTVGADTFYGMNPEQQAALTSITYNYGKLPDRVASVVNNVDPSTPEGQKAISDAIRSLEGDNDGVNRDRRNSEADLFLGQGDVPETSVVEKPDTGVSPEQRDKNVETIKKQIGDDAEPTGVEKFFYDVIGNLGLGLGKPLADNLRGKSREARQAIIDQHLYALENGATPKTDEEGNYIGFDISTMDTFADKMLAAEDIMAFMPPSTEASSFTVTQDMIDSLRASGLNAQADALTVGQTLNLSAYNNPAYQADADGDGVIDSVRFDQVYGAQSTAADEDPYGMSTEQGFITEDGREFFVDATGKVVEVTDSVVPFNVGGGDDTTDIFSTTTMTDDGGDDDTTTTTTDGTDTGHVDGVCNNPDYVYNPETDKCEPKKEEETDGDLGSPITTAITPRSFDEVLRSVVVPAPRIAPISENIRPMQGGGMAGLNRAADNFLKALAG